MKAFNKELLKVLKIDFGNDITGNNDDSRIVKDYKFLGIPNDKEFKMKVNQVFIKSVINVKMPTHGNLSFKLL